MTEDADVFESAEDGSVIHLTIAECWKVISVAPYGRIATAVAGYIDIFPINHRVDQRTIVFRTSPGSKLIQLAIKPQIAFEVDDCTDGEAYSVVVRGVAQEIDADTGRADDPVFLGVRPWQPGEKEHWVRIIPTEIQGRRFKRTS